HGALARSAGTVPRRGVGRVDGPAARSRQDSRHGHEMASAAGVSGSRAGDVRAWAKERLVDNRSLDEWFRPQAVHQLLHEHDSGRVNHGKRLWALLMF